MTAIAIGKFTPGTEEWVEARRRRIGGSEIAAVLGISPFTSPFSLWHEKANGVRTFDGNAYTEWGTRLEPVVAAKFCEEHPEWEETPEQGWTYIHSDREWQSASPDVFLFNQNERTFCEVKTARRDDAWYDGIPVYYRTQVLWTMDVLGVDHAWLAVLISGSDYREYQIELDDEAAADLQIMRAAGQAFIASIEAGAAPDIDDTYSTYQTLRRMHPDIEIDTEHEVSRDVAEAFLNANQELAEAERVQRRARSDIARHMKRAQYATCDGVRIARRQPGRGDGPPVLVSTRRHLPPREAVA